jgi:hypothetical protein
LLSFAQRTSSGLKPVSIKRQENRETFHPMLPTVAVLCAALLHYRPGGKGRQEISFDGTNERRGRERGAGRIADQPEGQPANEAADGQADEARNDFIGNSRGGDVCFGNGANWLAANGASARRGRRGDRKHRKHNGRKEQTRDHQGIFQQTTGLVPAVRVGVHHLPRAFPDRGFAVVWSSATIHDPERSNRP